MATLSLFLSRRDAGAWSVLEILGATGDPLEFSARGDAGVWRVLEILDVSADLLVVVGALERWRVERPRDSLRNP